jgi:hypothetical protein
MWWYHNTSITDCWLICRVWSARCVAGAEAHVQWCGAGLSLTVYRYGGYDLAMQCYRWDNILRLAVQQWMRHGFHWGRVTGWLGVRCVSEGGRSWGMLNRGANWCRQDLKQASDDRSLQITFNFSEELYCSSFKILTYCSTLKMQRTGSSEMVMICQITWHHIPEDSNIWSIIKQTQMQLEIHMFTPTAQQFWSWAWAGKILFFFI